MTRVRDAARPSEGQSVGVRPAVLPRRSGCSKGSVALGVGERGRRGVGGVPRVLETAGFLAFRGQQQQGRPGLEAAAPGTGWWGWA